MPMGAYQISDSQQLLSKLTTIKLLSEWSEGTYKEDKKGFEMLDLTTIYQPKTQDV